MNKNHDELITKIFKLIINQGQIDLVDEVYSEDFVDESVAGGSGRTFIKVAYTDWRRAFPDLHLEIQEIITESNKIAVRWIATGTHVGQFNHLPPTHKRICLLGISLFEVLDNMVTKEWTCYDRYQVLKQLEGQG